MKIKIKAAAVSKGLKIKNPMPQKELEARAKATAKEYEADELQQLSSTQLEKLLKHASDKLVEQCGNIINSKVVAVVEARIDELKDAVSKTIDTDFDKRIETRVRVLTSQQAELSSMPYKSTFMEIKKMLDQGWKVLDINPGSGVVLQREKSKATKKDKPEKTEGGKVGFVKHLKLKFGGKHASRK